MKLKLKKAWHDENSRLEIFSLPLKCLPFLMRHVGLYVNRFGEEPINGSFQFFLCKRKFNLVPNFHVVPPVAAVAAESALLSVFVSVLLSVFDSDFSSDTASFLSARWPPLPVAEDAPDL